MDGVNDNDADAASWAHWLRRALDDSGLRPIDIQNASGIKENGRPVIDRSRVSQWLNKPERPSFDFTLRVAEILKRPAADALTAAGYDSPGDVTVEYHRADGVLEAFVIRTESPEEQAALEAFRAGWRAGRDSPR